MQELTPKEEKFCSEYVLLLNATQAAINAQYSKRSARQLAARLLSKDYIQNRVEYLRKNLAETAEISALRVLKEHEKIAFADAGQLRNEWMSLKDFGELTPEQKAIIQEITTKQTKYGTEIKVRLFDKQRALEAISNMLGFNAPEKREVTGKDGKDLMIEPIMIEIIDSRDRVDQLKIEN
jgi:phage terminase small subunit